MVDHIHGDSTIQGPTVAPKLQVLRGDSPGQKYSLKFKTRVGRESDNDIAIVDPRISRYHFQITFEEGKWLLADLGSVNGTTINGMAVTVPLALTHGDQISIGETVLVYRDPIAEEAEPFDPTATVHGRTGGPQLAQSTISNRRMAWIAGGLILTLILLVAGLLIWLRREPETTEAEAVTATATSQTFAILRSTPDPELNLALKYEDDFSDSFGGWDDAFGDNYTKQYGNNKYHIEITTNNLVVWGLANRRAADFEAEVEVTKEDGGNSNSYGLIFRYVDHDNYYRFDISGDGYFLLSKFQAGQWHTLADWTNSTAINQGATAINVLKVSANGPEIAVSANGEELARVTDTAFNDGNFGFFASTFDQGHLWVSFDNIKLWAPPDQEIVLIPTAAPIKEAAIAEQAEVEPTPTPTATVTPPTVVQAATATPSPADDQPTTAPEPTPTATVEPVSAEPASLEPTPTPEPLPDFVSRDQPLARGERALSGKLYFPVFDVGRGTYDIYRANPNGTEQELIQTEASQVALNNDGTLIAYRSWKADERGLITRGLEAADKWIFVKFFEAASPVFSADGQFFVFHSRQGGQTPGVYRTFGLEHDIIRRESIPVQGEMVALTTDNKMVYRGCIVNTCGLVLSNLDGSFPQQLTDHADDTAPSISPDGQKIAFMSNRAGDWDIYTISIDGQNLTQLTTSAGNDGLPAWAPDGKLIAFATDRDGQWAIWDMAPNGQQQRQLFILPGPIDGQAQVDIAHAFGWLEERIVWTR